MRYWFLLFVFLALPALAHPSVDFDENNCHICVDGCEAWALSPNEYHCHLSDGSYTNKLGQQFDASGQMIDESQKINFVSVPDDPPPETNNPIPDAENNLAPKEQVAPAQIVDINTNALPTTINETIDKKYLENNNINSSDIFEQDKATQSNIIIYFVVGLLILSGSVLLIKIFKNRK